MMTVARDARITSRSAKRGTSGHISLKRVWKKFNWRFAILAAVLGLFVGYPLYLYLYMTVTGGITRHGDLMVVDLKAMSTFDMDQDNGTSSDIPPRFRALDGKRVRLTGQMWEPYNAGGRVAGFELVYSIANCCFSGPPKVQHFIHATVVPDRSVESSDGFVDVTGTLHVGVEHDHGRVSSVYRIDVEKVEVD